MPGYRRFSFISLILFAFACGGERSDVVLPTSGAPVPVRAAEEKFLGRASSAIAGAPIDYTVAIPLPDNHMIDVEALIPVRGTDSVEVMMPVWTPGSYLVREYARHVEGLGASSYSGKSLPITKTRKNRWRINTRGADRIRLSYRVYCNDLSVRGNFVTDDYAIINGAPTFMTLVDGKSEREHRVRFVLPAGWNRSFTGLEPASRRALHHYVADSYDTLVDSPVLLGNATAHDFEVRGVPHTIVYQGGKGIWNRQKSIEDVARITRTIVDFWGEIPYARYVYLNVIDRGRGGLEHLNSTLTIGGRWASGLREDYIGWLGLMSHEFFHTWNVKRLRPAALGPFDYEKEVHTTSLWVAEGLTSYYDDLLLKRAGLMTEKEYLEKLSKQIDRLQSTPGRLHHPLGMTSYDAWIKFYRRDENSQNTTVSYYTKGAVVGFLLDAKIRNLTGGDKSLDDVMRLAYARYSGKVGYTPGDFRKVAGEVAGADLSEFFARAVDGVEDLDYDEALEYFGLRFKDPDAKDEEKDDTSGAPEDPPAGWLGLKTRTTEGRLFVDSVVRGGPARAGGLSADDELLAMDGYRVTPSDFEERLKHYQPGVTVRLLISRRAMLKRRVVTLGENPEGQWELEQRSETTGSQKENLSAWLGAVEIHEGGDH